MKRAAIETLSRKILPLRPAINHYAWGGTVLPELLGREVPPGEPTSEAWLTSTQEEGLARIEGTDISLAELVEQRPEVLGSWSRRLFGDELPIFAKFLSSRFPPRVHVGFSPEALGRRPDYDPKTFPAVFLKRLQREQELLRTYYSLLSPRCTGSEEGFAQHRAAYESWAVDQAVRGWSDMPRNAAFARVLADYVQDGVARETLDALLDSLRDNRAWLVECFNEVDLRTEQGKLLLTRAGIAHAIFGLSHQGHAQDHARERLGALYAELGQVAARGADTAELEALADATTAELASLRSQNRAPPKNEGWLPFEFGGEILILEPQQTSNTTYSWLDVYTPFVWKDGRMVFRKGEATTGVSDAQLAEFVSEIDFEPTPLAELLHEPAEIAAGDAARRTRVYRLMDDAPSWPYFTLHRVDLDGSPGEPAAWPGAHPRGAWQQIIVISGAVGVIDAAGETTSLGPGTPGFVPATLEGGYRLESDARASVVLVSVPVPEGRGSGR